MLYSKDVFKDRVKAILKEHKKAKVMILTDSSQAPSTEIEYPEEFQKEENQITLEEVVRSTPILTKATRLFQRYDQGETRNHLDDDDKGQGLRPRAIVFESSGEDTKTYMTKILDEVKHIQGLCSPKENFHTTIAIIVSDDDARDSLLNAGLKA